jgi:hypothetical protein
MDLDVRIASRWSLLSSDSALLDHSAVLRSWLGNLAIL